MNFYSPWSLLFLSAMMPILVMYMMKKRHQEMEVSSIKIWKPVILDIEVNKPWQKLKKSLLLFMQLLAVLLLTFALAGPFLKSSSTSAKNNIILIDTSLSMRAQDMGKSRFITAVERAIELVNGLSPGARISLITVCANTSVLCSYETNKTRVIQKLKGIESSFGGAQYEDVENLLLSMVKSEASSQIYAYTDKKLDFPTLKIKQDLLGDIQSEASDNAAVLFVSNVKKDNEAIVMTKIANYALRDKEIPVSLYVDGKLFDSKRETVKANQEQIVTFTKVPPDSRKLEIRLDVKDAIAADNQGFDIVQNDKKTKIPLCTDKNVFLEKALTLVQNSVLFKADKENAQILSGYDVYVLDDKSTANLPEKGNFLIFNPPPNPYFHVDKNFEPGTVSPSNHYIFRFVNDYNFKISASRQIALPSWGKNVLVADGKLLAFCGTVGNRTFVVFGFDVHASDIALYPTFPVMINNVIAWFNREADMTVRRIQPDSRQQLQLRTDAMSADITTPEGRKEIVAPPFPPKIFTDTRLPGFYTLRQQTGNSEQVGYLVANAAKEELSNLKVRRTIGSEVGLQTTSPLKMFPNIQTEWNLTGVFIGLLLLLILLEWWVYVHVY